MKHSIKIIFLLIFLLAAIYLVYPTPGMPPPPSGSLVSLEPADTESIYRTAYYTHLTRSQIMDYYQTFWQHPFIRLIIPPEDAATVIRDQARSSWIEELVHPLKDTLYINGFYPDKPTEQINLEGEHWEGKIIIHLYPSHPITRLTVLLLASAAGYFLVKEYAKI